MHTLNEAFSTLTMQRRYEVWFLRIGLADGRGAWWFRYLLLNPGKKGCPEHKTALPIQVWATWFPVAGKPITFIEGFPLGNVDISRKGKSPFHLAIQNNRIEENCCLGRLQLDGHEISWDLQYSSTFRTTLSNKGWIGFSCTPHSDAIFSGEITFDGRKFAGDPLGFGVQGHNCGYRHRDFWTWAHVYFPREGQAATTLEALKYQMPFGLTFRKVVLWHNGRQSVFRTLVEDVDEADKMIWNFVCDNRKSLSLQARIDGRGAGAHHLPYLKTNCKGIFEVRNNSLASASLRIERNGYPSEVLDAQTCAVLEVVV